MLFVIDGDDLKQYNNGIPGNKVEKIFKRIVKSLDKSLRAEAGTKGFVLNQDWCKEVITRTLVPQTVDCSDELKEALKKLDCKILYIEID